RNGKPGIVEATCRQFRAPFLIVARSWIIHGVMKPERELHRRGLLREMPRLVEFSEALRNVLLIVIVPMRFRVSRYQPCIPHRRIAPSADTLPAGDPSILTWQLHALAFRKRR